MSYDHDHTDEDPVSYECILCLLEFEAGMRMFGLNLAIVGAMTAAAAAVSAIRSTRKGKR